MPDKDHSSITLTEALEWAQENTKHNDVCKRLRSRAVVKRLLQHIDYLDTCVLRLSEENGDMQEQLEQRL
jgi:hypothetical protein